jgi:hypothetical protein
MGRYGYYYDDYYFFAPGAGVILPNPGGGTASSGHGRVVNGSGYTQVVPRGPENDQAGNSNGTRNRGGDAGASSVGGSNSGSSGVSSGGYSSGGGGGGDSGRTAVPR